MRTLVLAGVLLAACGPDHEPLPPPPANAVASCASERTPILGVSTSTIWIDAADRVIRVDGTWSELDGDTYAIPYYFEYDDQGRLVAKRYDHYDYRFDYSAQTIMRTESGVDNWRWDLVDGRVMHAEGPPGVPSLMQNHVDYEYDTSGRIARRSGGTLYEDEQGKKRKQGFDHRFTYDAQGRVATSVAGRLTKTWAYTESATQLMIRIDETDPLLDEVRPVAVLTYDFDASHRIVRSVANWGGTFEQFSTYAYGDDEIIAELGGSGIPPAPQFRVRSSGACDAPALVLAPPLPVPPRWGATYISIPNVATDAMLNEM